MKAPAQPLSASDVEQRLLAAGIQPTAQRIAIGRFVLGGCAHPSAETLKGWVDESFPKISLPTVYNTLNVLVEAGLLREVKLPHQDHARYDCNTAPHAHFVDIDTGEVFDLPADVIQLDAAIAARYGVEHVDVVLHGRRPRQV